MSAGRYYHTLSFLQQVVTAREKREGGALDTIDNLRELYKEDW